MRSIFFTGVLATIIWACGVNFTSPFVTGEGDAYYLEEARIALNAKDYARASKALDNIKEPFADKVFMQVSVLLGSSGLAFWDILVNLINTVSAGSSSDSGVDKLFNTLSDTVFGVGAERDSRLAAINSSITLLKAETDNKKAESFYCLLTGILVLPRVNESTASLLVVTQSLTDVQKSLSAGNACPDLTSLNTALAAMKSIQTDLDFVLAQTETCDLLNFNDATADLNSVKTSLKKFTDNADKGCSPVACDHELCDVLATGCIREALNSDTAVAGDGKIEVCEIVQNCQGGACF